MEETHDILRPHGVEGLLTDEQDNCVRELARELGLTREEYLRRLVDVQIDKLLHLQRCKPKVGRKQLSPEQASVRILGKAITSILLKLRQDYGAEFESKFGELEAEAQEAIKTNDLVTLQRIESEKKWIFRRW